MTHFSRYILRPEEIKRCVEGTRHAYEKELMEKERKERRKKYVEEQRRTPKTGFAQQKDVKLKPLEKMKIYYRLSGYDEYDFGFSYRDRKWAIWFVNDVSMNTPNHTKISVSFEIPGYLDPINLSGVIKDGVANFEENKANKIVINKLGRGLLSTMSVVLVHYFTAQYIDNKPKVKNHDERLIYSIFSLNKEKNRSNPNVGLHFFDL